MTVRGFISRMMGGGDHPPPVPPLTEEQRQAEGNLDNAVQRAVSTQGVACRAIRAGNGRVIQLLQESLGKEHAAS